MKPTSIVSYNHLGNNDGLNLSAPQTFRSKEISKSNVVDDVVGSNELLYAKVRPPPSPARPAAPRPSRALASDPKAVSCTLRRPTVRCLLSAERCPQGESPDHVVVIKYVPYVGDSKRAMDEYSSEIFMGGAWPLGPRLGAVPGRSAHAACLASALLRIEGSSARVWLQAKTRL